MGHGDMKIHRAFSHVRKDRHINYERFIYFPEESDDDD